MIFIFVILNFTGANKIVKSRYWVPSKRTLHYPFRMDQKLRASQYFSTNTHSTDSSISSIHAFMLKEYRKSVTNCNNFYLNKEVNRDIPNNFETRPETPKSQDKKSYIGMGTDRRNYLKSNFPTTFSRRYSVASVSSSEVGKIETEDIATSLLTSGKLYWEKLSFTLRVSSLIYLTTLIFY